MKERCDNCYFAHPSTHGGAVTCKRFPPFLVKENDFAFFPIMHKGDWCGEWKTDKAGDDSPR